MTHARLRDDAFTDTHGPAQEATAPFAAAMSDVVRIAQAVIEGALARQGLTLDDHIEPGDLGAAELTLRIEFA